MLIGATTVLILGQALAASTPPVTFLTPEALASALRPVEGRPAGLEMAELARQPGYAVLALRRTSSGSVEVHTEWADVWYVVRGNATLVTGGNVVEGATTEPGEIRGKGITGGEPRPLKGGEVIVIPPGVPHWISEVQGELVYLVVKAPIARPETK